MTRDKSDFYLNILITMLLLLLFVSKTAFANTDARHDLIDFKVTTLSSGEIAINFTFAGDSVNPRYFATEDPTNIIIDFPNTRNLLTAQQSKKTIDLGLLQNVSIVQNNERTRVILDVLQISPIKIEKFSNMVSVVIAESPKSFQQNLSSFQDFSVKNIDFRRDTGNVGKIFVQLSSDKMALDISEGSDYIILNLLDTTLPSKLARKYDVSDFGTPVTYLTAEQKEGFVQMRFYATGLFDKMVYQVGDEVIVEFRPVTEAEFKEIQAKQDQFVGERLSLNFQDIDIRAVLKVIADFTGFNIVVADGVTGRVTVRLQNVPWDQALDLILKSKGLTKRQVGNVVTVNTLEAFAQQEQNELAANRAVIELAIPRLEIIPINYAAAADIAKILQSPETSLLSSVGSVSIDERTNTLLINETPEKLEAIRAIIKDLDKAVKQVEISSYIVDVSEESADVFGARLALGSFFEIGKWGVGQSDTRSNAYNISQGAPITFGNTGVLFEPFDASTEEPTPASNGRIGFSLARLPGGTLVDFELEALETEGYTKTIARPKLITEDQKEAFIKVGQSIPYQEASSSGATSVSFKEAVLELKVTPRITPDNKVGMDLNIKQDSRAPSSQNVEGEPAINTREISTRVLVDNGETIVLGGVFQQTTEVSKKAVPFFGQLPLIGYFFSRDSSKISKSEIMVFITPRIVDINKSS